MHVEYMSFDVSAKEFIHRISRPPHDDFRPTERLPRVREWRLGPESLSTITRAARPLLNFVPHQRASAIYAYSGDPPGGPRDRGTGHPLSGCANLCASSGAQPPPGAERCGAVDLVRKRPDTRGVGIRGDPDHLGLLRAKRSRCTKSSYPTRRSRGIRPLSQGRSTPICEGAPPFAAVAGFAARREEIHFSSWPCPESEQYEKMHGAGSDMRKELLSESWRRNPVILCRQLAPSCAHCRAESESGAVVPPLRAYV